MESNPAVPGGSSTSKPTWSNTSRCSATSAFFVFGGPCGPGERVSHRRETRGMSEPLRAVFADDGRSLASTLAKPARSQTEAGLVLRAPAYETQAEVMIREGLKRGTGLRPIEDYLDHLENLFRASTASKTAQ
jgi:hypothetical protein